FRCECWKSLRHPRHRGGSTAARRLRPRPFMNMAGNENEGFNPIAALGVWELVWAGIELLIVETRELLGSHLREEALSIRRLPSDGEREAGELTIGRTRL